MKFFQAIEVDDLSFGYDGNFVLENLSLMVAKGEFIGIVGPNGGGKTTLLKLIMGFLRPTKGAIHLFGAMPEKMRLKIGYVPQIHRIDRDFPITVHELVMLGALSKADLWSGDSKEIQVRADGLLERLGLREYQQEAFGSLSGGMAQRALIARSLLSDPEFLFLDEPTAHIDPPSTELILSLLGELKGKKTILLVSHDLKAIVDRVDRILCVDREANFFAPNQICNHVSMGLYPIALERTE